MKSPFRECVLMLPLFSLAFASCQSHGGNPQTGSHLHDHPVSTVNASGPVLGAANLTASHSFDVHPDHHTLKITPKRTVRVLVWINRPDDCTYRLHVDSDKSDSFTRTIDRHAPNDNKQHPDKGQVVIMNEGVTYTVWIEADLSHHPTYGTWVTNHEHPNANLHENHLDINWNKHPVFANAYFEVQG